MTYTDRSRKLEYERCPRARWWAYEWGRGAGSPAGGVRLARADVALSTGLAVHRGVEELLRVFTGRVPKVEGGTAPDFEIVGSPMRPVAVETAVAAALMYYWQVVHESGLAVETDAYADFVQNEQAALIEALIRAWARFRLPALLGEYRVLEVEREETMPIGVDTDGLVWQARPDAILERRRSDDAGPPDLLLYSLKTAAVWDHRRESEIQHDDQGLGETAAVEAQLANECLARADAITIAYQNITRFASLCDFDKLESAFRELQKLRQAEQTTPIQVSGVLMDFLIKGERREAEKGSGQWETRSPLIRAWRRQQVDPITAEIAWHYAWSWDWYCSETHTQTYSNGRVHECPGGARHTLGKDWELFRVWEQPFAFRVADRDFGEGITGWIEALASGLIQPEAGNPFEGVFVTPPPIWRQAQELENWRAQMTAQEQQVAFQAELVRQTEDPKNRLRLLNQYFPMHRRSCDYPTKCPFQDLSFGPTSAELVDPLSLGYVPREPHHQPEKDAFAQILAETVSAAVEETGIQTI